MIGCTSKNDNSISSTASIVEDTITPQQINNFTIELDSIKIDSILYHDKNLLSEIRVSNPFSYDIKYDESTKRITIGSKNIIARNILKYKIELLSTKSSFNEDDFYWYEEDSYKYLRSSFSVNGKIEDITGLKFINHPNEIIYPAGLWHWSVEGNSVKMYEHKENKIYLINGADLLCNGSQCNSFELMIVIESKTKITVNTLLLNGLWPYQFGSIKLFDLENDGNLEFYKNKDEVNEITGINDFILYSINKDGIVHLKI